MYFAFGALICGGGALYGWWRALKSERFVQAFLWAFAALAYSLLTYVAVVEAVYWWGV